MGALFRNAPDLMEDFKEFLPETAAHARAQAAVSAQATVSLSCTNWQILELAQSFRQCSDVEIIRWAEEFRQILPEAAAHARAQAAVSAQATVSLSCTDMQILELAQSFRQCTDEEILRRVEEFRQNRE